MSSISLAQRNRVTMLDVAERAGVTKARGSRFIGDARALLSDLTAERIEQLGATGLISPIKVTPEDHEGSPAAKIVQWDGSKWTAKTDWLKGDRPLFKEAIYARAAAYAKEKNLPPRDADAVN